MDITDVSFIESCCFKYLDGKWKRNDVSRLFVRFSDYSFKEVRDIAESGNKSKLFPIVTVIAEYMSECIKNRQLALKPIKYFIRIDGMSKKERVIGVQEPLHQMFDYVP